MTPVASQRRISVSVPSRSTGSSSSTLTSLDAPGMGPNGPTLTRPARPSA